MIPIVNGIQSNSWLWTSYTQGYKAVFIIDFIWLVLGLLALGFYFKMHPKVSGIHLLGGLHRHHFS